MLPSTPTSREHNEAVPAVLLVPHPRRSQSTSLPASLTEAHRCMEMDFSRVSEGRRASSAHLWGLHTRRPSLLSRAVNSQPEHIAGGQLDLKPAGLRIRGRRLKGQRKEPREHFGSGGSASEFSEGLFLKRQMWGGGARVPESSPNWAPREGPAAACTPGFPTRPGISQ